MTKYVFASKNVKSGNFNVPQLYDFDKDSAKEAFEISMKETPAAGVEAVKELEIYYLGEFDTKSGLFSNNEPEYIVSGLEVLGNGQKC